MGACAPNSVRASTPDPCRFHKGRHRVAGVGGIGNRLDCCSLLATVQPMYSITETEVFSNWLNGLKDIITRARLIKRLQRAALGNLGDTKPVGNDPSQSEYAPL